MIYTIGYQRITVNQLIYYLNENRITELVDVRSRPFGRRTVFNKPRLKQSLATAGINYHWAGLTLGGFSEINQRAIDWLASYQAKYTVCLMCMEADPKKCHRDYEIARRLKEYKIEVTHILT